MQEKRHEDLCQLVWQDCFDSVQQVGTRYFSPRPFDGKANMMNMPCETVWGERWREGG